MAIIESIDVVISGALAFLTMMIAYRFIRASQREGARHLETFGLNIFQMGVFLLIAECVLAFGHFFEVGSGVRLGLETIAFVGWLASTAFGAKMAYELANHLEEMLF